MSNLGWLTLPVKCRICGHEHVAVCDEETDTDSLECPECGNMTSEEVGEWE